MGWIKKVISVGGFILLGCQVVSANEVQSYPYALFWNDYQMTPGISKGAVSIDDVMEWRDICREALGDEMKKMQMRYMNHMTVILLINRVNF